MSYLQIRASVNLSSLLIGETETKRKVDCVEGSLHLEVTAGLGITPKVHPESSATFVAGIQVELRDSAEE